MSDQVQITDHKRSLIFFNILITCIATTMMSTALATALPPIVKDLNISVTTGQWLSSGYYLAMGIMIPITAFLITRFPTKKLYLTALGTFMAGLLLCLIANSFPVILFGRIMQACANGILTSMSQVVLLSIYPPENKGTIMGWYGLSLGAAPVLAPTIAGLLIDYFSWKAIFALPLIFILVSFVIALFIFDDVLDVSKKKFDITSFCMCVLTFGGVTLALGNIGTYSFMSMPVLMPLIIGIIATTFFANRQLHLKQPFLELRTLKTKNYTISVIGSMLLYLTCMASTVLLPIYVQSILGYSATVSGLVTLPGSLAMAVISPMAGKLYDKIGIKLIFIVAALVMLISNIEMFFITIHTPVIVAAIFNVLRQMAVGLLLMPFVTWGTGSLKKEFTAHGTALLTALRTTAGAIGMSAFVGIMTAVASNSTSLSDAEASLHGLNIAFLCLGITNIVLLAMAILGEKTVKNN